MYQDQRAAGTGGHQIRANHGLAGARRGDKNATVAREKRTGRLILNRRECSDETQRKRLTGDALVDDIKSDTETAEQGVEIGSAASGQRDMLREIFGAGNHPRGERRRQSHALLFVELRILEGCNTLDLVEQRRGQTSLRDEEPLREYR